MSSRRPRPSFLRPLTQIAPQPTAPTRPEGVPTPGRDAVLGPASMGSVASATYGPRPRSKSLVAQEAKVGQAPPTSSVGGRTGNVGAAISLPSSRRSSFATGHRRTPTREPTVSRRGSIWSEFGDEAPSGGIELNDEPKADEAQKAFANSTRLLWESGVDVMVTNAWAAFTACWKKGDIDLSLSTTLVFLVLNMPPLLSSLTSYSLAYNLWQPRRLALLKPLRLSNFPRRKTLMPCLPLSLHLQSTSRFYCVSLRHLPSSLFEYYLLFNSIWVPLIA
ncbi:hypothetical protein BS47DRAFT_780729 [Hydnum rufescens UP504]|uniref:Uncharacterized protein n=1 Tax=Hydnum rufescens UP504 TaxID=1448309 RepID=A0A9P6DUL9_9AGAM|nr:hypothetical protein BS47DRAFT_780729 [Hydnum rufescens UP504]